MGPPQKDLMKRFLFANDSEMQFERTSILGLVKFFLLPSCGNPGTGPWGKLGGFEYVCRLLRAA